MHELRVQALSRGLGARLNVDQGASDSCSPPLFFFIDNFSRGYSQKSTDLCKTCNYLIPDKSIYRIWYFRDRKGL